MTFILAGLILYCLLTAKYSKIREYNDGFLDRENTSLVNGVFVALILMSHFSQYVTEWTRIDSFVFLRFFRILGECIVATFLFYSGYGLMEQLKKDKNLYLLKLMLKRLPSLFIKFVLCVSLYIVLALVMKQTLTINQVLLSFIGLASVGNSAWYIFYMIYMYVAIFLSFRFINNEKICIGVLFFITVIYTIILYFAKYDSPAYYLVSFVMPTGVMFSYYKNKIIALLKSHYIYAFICFIWTFVFNSTFFTFRGWWSYSLTVISFMAVSLMLTIKIKFNNVVLRFLGNHILRFIFFKDFL